MTIDNKRKKKTKLRNNEYYDTQDTFDKLYASSKNNVNFQNLYEIVVSRQNILLAYRNMKKNTGSGTAGTDGKTIAYLEKMSDDELVSLIKRLLSNYHPKSVRRVEIPKSNGKTRPLGIPCITDRLIQQCFKQVLEPICEAKFHPDSHGFRPNRSTSHAIARVMFHMNMTKLHYCVDMDLKGFFDNVDHSKLLKQIWSLGIHDKKVISILSKMLKAEIHGIGIPKKGVPQGGILSPLLANIVLNELDWWISNQWQTFKTEHSYTRNDTRYHWQRCKSNLKEMYIVRYADDFKILCRNYETAVKVYHSTEQWLKDRLHLEISPEKSKITNLKKNYTEFLGFKIKVQRKNNKYVTTSRISDKAKERCIKEIKQKINDIKYGDNKVEILHYNSMVLGWHSYFCIATNVNVDFHDIAHLVKRRLYNRLRHECSNKGSPPKIYDKRYSKYSIGLQNGAPFIKGVLMLPIGGVSFYNPVSFTQETCNYTEIGRRLVHDKLTGINNEILRYLMDNPVRGQSIEFNDNRISLYVGQEGRCRITKQILEIGNMEVHHIKLKSRGGTDEYCNLIFITAAVHKLIHAVKEDIIQKYMSVIRPDVTMLIKINKYRKSIGNSVIA